MRRLLAIVAVLVAAAARPALAAEAGEAALAYLSRLQADEVAGPDLLKQTALSPHCGAERRQAIEWHLGGLADRLRSQPHQFAVLQEQRDGDFAAVLVEVRNEHDPLAVDVLALGFSMVDTEWRPAPMPGSFDNIDLGFDQTLARRVEDLELWMGAERVRRLHALQGDAVGRFREQMAKAVPDALLEKSSPRQYVEAFQAACREGNLPAVMRLLSDFEDGLSEEDRKLQQTIARGLQGLDQRAHWRLLTSPDVVRVIVQDDPGDDLDAEVVMLLFDPAAADSASLLRFVLLRVGKRWEIELPTSLRLADESRLEFQRAIWGEDDSDDDELRDRFEEYFEQQHEPRRVQELKETGKQIEQTLREGTLAELFQFVHRSEALNDSERRSAYRFLAKFWSDFHQDEQSPADGELVEVLEAGGTAVLVFHLLSTAQLERVNLTPLLLIREESGWAIAPGVTTARNYAALPKEKRHEQDRAIADFHAQEDDLAKKAAARFLDRFVAAAPREGGTVGRQEAAELVKTFRDRLRNSDLLKAFECCALLDRREGAWEAFRSLSYEHRGARLTRVPDRELQVAAQTHWAAVSLRLDGGPNSVPIYPMYLVVATEQGPRIVMDVGLRFATNKGREELNKRVWRRIEDHLDAEETALVRSLFQGHVESSMSDLAEWEKSNSNK